MKKETEKKLVNKIIREFIEIDSDANSTIKKQMKADRKAILSYVYNELDFCGYALNTHNIHTILNDLAFNNEHETYFDKLKDYK